MKNLRTLLLALAAICLLMSAFVVVGCGDDPNAPDANSNEPEKQRSEDDVKTEAENFNQPPPVQMLSGNETGVRGPGDATVLVARSPKEMKALLKRHFSRGTQKQPISETDYKTRQIVGVFVTKQKVGSTVTITDVYPNKDSDNFTVNAVLLVPPKDCKVPEGSKFTTVRPVNVVETALMKGEPKLVLKKQEISGC